MLTLRTPRLELVAAAAALARAEAEGTTEWWREIGAMQPDHWPPPLNDAASLRWFADATERDPDGLGWYTWYVTLPPPAEAFPRVIGNAGFTGRPDAHGSVEIGYSLLPAYHRRGYGTELVGALTRWAFSHGEVERVLAETYPDFIGSIRVLEKNGFAMLGRARRVGAIAFELRRSVADLRSR